MSFASLLRRAKRPVAAALVAFSALGPVHAAPPALTTAFRTVTIDGSATAWTTFAGSGQAFNVIYDGTVFHLWYRADDTGSISGLRHATSVDGENFTTQGGAFSFTVDPFSSGTPPYLYYDAVSNVGGHYKIIHWTFNGGAGTFADYNYNSSVSDIGASIGSTVATHQGPIGPIPVGTIGQTGGTFGIESGFWFGQCDLGRDVCRSAYTDTSPPTVAGSIYPPVFDADPLFGSLGIPTGYINNHGDVRPGGIGLDMAFTVRDGGEARFDRQVYFSESSDSGANWTAPVGLLPGAPTLPGGFGGNFAHPELLRTQYGAFLYVSVQNSAGDYIIAVSSPFPPPTPAQHVPSLSDGGLAATFALVGLVAAFALRRRRTTPR